MNNRTAVPTPTTAPAKRAPAIPRSVEIGVACLAVFAVGGRFTVQQGLTVAIVMAVLLVPVWLGPLMRMRGGIIVVILGVLTPLSGSVLTTLMEPTHRTNTSLEQMNAFLVIGLVGGIGLLVWARSVMGDGMTALVFGIGLFAAIPARGIDAANPWKLTLSVPTVIVVLAVCMIFEAKIAEILSLVALAFVGVFNDSRSATSILLIAASLLVWQLVRRRSGGRSSAWRLVGGLALFGFIAYNALQTFILDGWLGEGAQARSEAQIQVAGSIIAGGRPEMGATVALLLYNPFGFGSGTIPTFSDVIVAKTGMHSLNYAPNNGYVENYMLGGGFEVHSLTGDFWLRFGLIGAALLLTLVVLTIVGTARSLVDHAAHGLLIVLAIQVTWDALFSPLFSTSLSTLSLGVALAMIPRRQANGQPSALPGI